jgi:hypothetical protein
VVQVKITLATQRSIALDEFMFGEKGPTVRVLAGISRQNSSQFTRSHIFERCDLFDHSDEFIPLLIKIQRSVISQPSLFTKLA